MDSADTESATNEHPVYRCPGERYTIDRSTHLGRLASFYTKCHACPHRDDTATLSKNIRKRLVERQQRVSVSPELTGDVLQGHVGQTLTVALAKEVAQRFGIWLHKTKADNDIPKVIVASDGRPLTAPLVSALSAGLAWAGCGAIDVGNVVVPAAIDAQAEHAASGSISVGNTPGDPETASVRLFGPQGRPLSLDKDIRLTAASSLARPSRHAPPAQRAVADRPYLDRLSEYFHALRPLRFVLDTPSETIINWTETLLSQVACSATLLRDGRRFVGIHERGSSLPRDAADSDDAKRDAAREPSPTQAPQANPAGPPREVSRVIRDEAAHFGLMIDGDGRTLQVYDEKGRQLTPEELFFVLATLGGDADNTSPVVVPHRSEGNLVDALQQDPTNTIPVTGPPLSVHHTMLETNAAWGLDPQGVIWHRNQLPTPDALQAMAHLLVALSRSDRQLSVIVAEFGEITSRGNAILPAVA